MRYRAWTCHRRSFGNRPYRSGSERRRDVALHLAPSARRR